MTAIGGMVCFGESRIDRSGLERAASALGMYGPHAVDHLRLGNAGFFRCLLRVCPEDQFDNQPLYHADSGVALVFDGRLDNRKELSRRCGIGSEGLESTSDASLVLQLMVEVGNKSVDLLKGDYALAVWRSKDQRLLLARGPLGRRPLYWHRSDHSLCFATMPKGIFALSHLQKKVDIERLRYHLALVPFPGDSSFFENVQRVQPGATVEFHPGGVINQTFYRLRYSPGIKKSRDDEFLDEFKHLFNQAVSRSLRSAGGVASHLSGGLDSGAVTALAAKLMEAHGSRMLAYTSVPSADLAHRSGGRMILDEGERAGKLAARFPNLEHHRIRVDSKSMFEGLNADIDRLDCPPLNPCNMMWVNAINEDAAGRGCSVVLTGLLGNMTISRPGSDLLRQLFCNGRFVRWIKEARGLRRVQVGIGFRELLYFSFLPMLPNVLYRNLERRLKRDWSLDRYSAVRLGRVETKMFRQSKFGRFFQPTCNPRQEAVAFLENYDSGDYFAAANCFGVEMRDPTTDIDLLEFMFRLPEDQLLRHGQYRWLLRKAVGSLLPDEYFDRSRVGVQSADWKVHLDKDFHRFRTDVSSFGRDGRVCDAIDTVELSMLAEHWGSADGKTKRTDRDYRYKFLRAASGGRFVKVMESDNRE